MVLLVYLDDLLVITADFESHVQLSSKVVKHLSDAGLAINMLKSKLCYSQFR